MTDVSVGSSIAGCRLEAVAGRGGMGVVYRATQLALDRPVAVKAMAPQLAEDDAYRERFQRESRLAASIDHPNVIPVYEAGEIDGTLYLIMRYVDGTDLRAMLRERGRLAPKEAVRLLRPVASALAAAHRRGLVHRDVKPANVLITTAEGGDESHVYLTDFGIARRTDGEGGMTRTGVLVGTLDYTAPERIEGGKGTPASDIYAFGCMLFETVTGRIPFDRPTELTKMHAHLNDPIPPAHELAPEVPATLDAVIERAMAKHPEDRFESASELVTALTRSLDELQTGEVEFAQRMARADLPTDETEVAAEAEPEVAAEAEPEVAAEAEPEVAAEAEPEPTPEQQEETVAAPTAAVSPRPSHRGALLAGGAALIVVVVLVVILASGGGGSGGGGAHANSTPAGPTSQTQTQTHTHATGTAAAPPHLTRGRSIDLGGTPIAVSAGADGIVWALTAGKLRAVGPGGSMHSIAVTGGPKLLAAVPNGVWVGGGTGQPQLFDTAGHVSKSASVPASPSVIASEQTHPTALWAAYPSGMVLKGGSARSATTTPAAISVAVGEGHVWVANGEELTEIGLGFTKQAAHEAGDRPISVALDSGVWTATADGHVIRFNPISQQVGANRKVAPSLDAIAAIEGGNQKHVWAMSKQARTVYALDPNAHVIASEKLTSNPVAITATTTAVWVATADGKLTELTAP